VSRPQLALVALFVPVVALILLILPEPARVAPEADEFVPDPAPRGYVCYRARGPITIDGKLDDAAWADAPWSEPFRDIEGDLRPDPPMRTRMKMVWDDRALYIAAELEEPDVWATLTTHDAVIFHDNDFEVFLDPDGDGQLYGELELNALNTTWDLLLPKPYKDGGRAVDAWEIAGLKTAVHVDGTLNDPTDSDRGWTVEIAWPWKGLKELAGCPVPPGNGDQWRINFSRVEWDHEVVAGKYQKVPKRPEHNWVWSPQGVINMHRPERWGVLQFSTDPPTKTALRPDPAQPARDYLHRVYYSQTDYRKEHGRYANRLADVARRLRAGQYGLASPRLETTSHGFEASVELTVRGAEKQRWRITHEARITRDP
jgi:Carbohydrate family 9 binding domain-like